MTDPDREFEQRIARALAPDSTRTPPDERVEAVRSHATQRAAKSPAPQPGVTAGDTVQTRVSGPSLHSGAEILELRKPARPATRRAVLIGGVAASVGAAFGVSGALFATRDEDEPQGPPTEPIEFAAVDDGVRTTAALINHTWGTELMLDIEGLPGDTTYQVVYAKREDQVPAGSFLSVAGTVMRCRFNAAVLRSDVTRIAVAAPDGLEVLTADLA